MDSKFNSVYCNNITDTIIVFAINMIALTIDLI